VCREPCYVLLTDDHLPGGQRDEARDRVQERRLARAVGADQAGDLPLLELEIDAVDGPNPLEVDP
jgi:hypothetical protein